MKATLTRISAFLLVLALMVTMFPTASAATTWPGLSTSGYCEMVAPFQMEVYQDNALTIRGTTSPRKSYNASVYQNDVIRIYEITQNYTVLAYPTSSGLRVGRVRTSALFGVSSPIEAIRSAARVTTYKNSSTASPYGYIDAGDLIYKLGITRSGFILVIYPATSGSRQYKAAYIPKADYERLTGSSNGADVSVTVQQRLNEILLGKQKYNSYTQMTVNKRFTGTRSAEQCKGYAKNVFEMVFGITAGSTLSYPNNYLLCNTVGMTCTGSVTAMTEANLRNLFTAARRGDFVQMRRTHGGSHSAIVYSLNDTNGDGILDGVTFLEANLDGKNTVYLRHYTWSDLCSKNSAMSVYTASNYNVR